MNNEKKKSEAFFMVTFAIYWISTISILSLANVKKRINRLSHIYCTKE